MPRGSGSVSARNMDAFVRAMESGGIGRWHVTSPSRIIHMIRYVKKRVNKVEWTSE